MYDRADTNELFDTLLKALSRHREFDVINSRNKIYAVLNLINDDDCMIASIFIEYTKFVIQIYLVYARFEKFKNEICMKRIKI